MRAWVTTKHFRNLVDGFVDDSPFFHVGLGLTNATGSRANYNGPTTPATSPSQSNTALKRMQRTWKLNESLEESMVSVSLFQCGRLINSVHCPFPIVPH